MTTVIAVPRRIISPYHEVLLPRCLYTFGDRDVIVIYSVPDESTAAALSVAVKQAGSVSITTTSLLTV